MPITTILKLIKYGAPVLLVLGIVYGVYNLGSTHGKAEVQSKWDAQKHADDLLTQAIINQNQIDEAAHRKEDRRISDELVSAKEKAASAVAAAQLANAERLRSSDHRAALYRAQAEAGAAERADLASHAAELDRLLSESLGILEEGRILVELRDGQILGLAAQIQNDRQLIEGNDPDVPDAASAE